MTSATVSMHSLLKLISICAHVILGSFEGLLHALPHKVFLLKSALVFISVLMISIPSRPSLKTYSQQSNDRNFWFLACFLRWPRRAIPYSILSKLHLIDLHFINFAIR